VNICLSPKPLSGSYLVLETKMKKTTKLLLHSLEVRAVPRELLSDRRIIVLGHRLAVTREIERSTEYVSHHRVRRPQDFEHAEINTELDRDVVEIGEAPAGL
jgi:hypothetical protein